MARRRQSSTLEDLVDMAAMLPWWGGLSVALIVYILLHSYASQALPAIVDGNVSSIVRQSLFKALATAGQYILPIAFVMGAIISFFKRLKRKTLFNNVASAESSRSIRNISWQEFEQLVGQYFRLEGYAVSENEVPGPDGGVDLRLRKGNELFLVQCKQWQATKVSVNIIREIFGVMTAEGATGSFVVTSGVFTKDAIDFAKFKNIELINGKTLEWMIQQVKAQESNILDDLARIPKEPTPLSPQNDKAPSCPSCKQSMVKRQARRGKSTGNYFWGCSNFPKCRGIRHL